MTRDQWLLTGAWAAMAAFGSLTYYKVSHSPEIDPTVAKLVWDLDHARGNVEKPGPVPRRDMLAIFGPVVDAHPADPRGTVFRTQAKGDPILHPPVDVLVLPFPVMGDAKADLDGASILWSVAYRPVELKDYMRRKDAKPSGFLVFRQKGDAAMVQIAELGPEAKSYQDLSVEARQTYRYWVAVKGLENDRAGDGKQMVPIVNRADSPATAHTPSATRVRLVGGDKSHAVLKVETYNREKKCWVPKTLLVDPGQAVATTGWTLKGLRFDNFTLVADLTDGDGAAQVLTTGE